MFIIIGLLFALLLSYFLLRVCIQFSYICNLDLPYGMDLNTLYEDTYDRNLNGIINHNIQVFALFMYRYSKKLNIKA